MRFGLEKERKKNEKLARSQFAFNFGKEQREREGEREDEPTRLDIIGPLYVHSIYVRSSNPRVYVWFGEEVVFEYTYVVHVESVYQQLLWARSEAGSPAEY